MNVSEGLGLVFCFSDEGEGKGSGSLNQEGVVLEMKNSGDSHKDKGQIDN